MILMIFLLCPFLSIIFAQEADDSEIIYVTEPYRVETRNIACMEVVKRDSDLTFKQLSNNTQEICGTFLAGDLSDVISVEIVDTDVDCNGDEVLELFDGWTTQSGILPSAMDHEISVSNRVVNYCDWMKSGHQGSLIFTSSQNVALIQYRLRPNHLVTFRFRKIHNDQVKCHMVSPLTEGEYTMKSVRGRNCTFSIIQPTQLLIKKVLLRKNQEGKNNSDTIEILNGDSLDPSNMNVVHKYTSPTDIKEHQQIALEKSYTVVRMTSSDDGFHDNVITFRYSKLIQGSPQAEECHLQ